MTRYELDARYLLCPLPVIRTQNRIAELEHGDTLEVQCTDPGAIHDIPAWCRVHGHEVISISHEDDGIRITVRAGARD